MGIQLVDGGVALRGVEGVVGWVKAARLGWGGSAGAGGLAAKLRPKAAALPGRSTHTRTRFSPALCLPSQP